jgi:Leucine-rich repeat (LRR) protein
LVLAGKCAFAQQPNGLTAAETEEYQRQTEHLVRYLEETLNFIGHPESTVQEKEVIINDSYLKIFRDDKVQIEDDLDENRDIPLNKDVQAYLKDVDFFFRSVSFSFEVIKVDQRVNELGDLFFRVELLRKLRGRTINGDTVSTTRQRFLEINLDPFRKELKIASLYTTRLNEREELRNWWNEMPLAWKKYFGGEVLLFDTIPLHEAYNIVSEGIVLMKPYKLIRRDTVMVMGSDTLSLAHLHMLHGRPPDTLLYRADTLRVFRPDTLKLDMSFFYSILRDFTRRTEVNIAYKQEFNSLKPLEQLSELKVVDFSNTPIEDLLPLRNLNQLDAIYMSGTEVKDLTPLRYSVNVREIYCFNTAIDNLEPLSEYRQLEKLFCFNTAIASLDPILGMTSLISLRVGNTNITDISPVSSLNNLRLFDINNTSVSDLGPLQSLGELQMLNFEQTAVTSIEALRGLNALSIVQFSNTGVDDLSPLNGKQGPRKIYCDNTGITNSAAISFMRNNPGTLIIFETEELSSWWNSLPIYWKALLAEQTGKTTNPGPEELHEIITITHLDISGNRFLQNIQPVGRFANLSSLSLSQTEIVDLSPLIGLSELRELDLSDTRISDLEPLRSLLGIEMLNIERTRVDNLDALIYLASLRLVLADQSRIGHGAVRRLRHELPQVLVVYQTSVLREWWNNLQINWRDVFEFYVLVSPNPTAIQLQTVANQKVIEFGGADFTSLEPLRQLTYLQRLAFSSTNINDLQFIAGLVTLEELELPSNPVSSLQHVKNLERLLFLNIENTPVSDIAPISQLVSLKKLNISGTLVRNLKPLGSLNALEDLAFYNTRVRNAGPVEDLPALKHVKCYNTSISARRIQQWRVKRPQLNILHY